MSDPLQNELDRATEANRPGYIAHLERQLAEARAILSGIAAKWNPIAEWSVVEKATYKAICGYLRDVPSEGKENG